MITLKAIVCTALFVLVIPCALAQPAADIPSLAREIAALKEGQAAILKEIRELKGAIQQEQAPSVPTVTSSVQRASVDDHDACTTR